MIKIKNNDTNTNYICFDKDRKLVVQNEFGEALVFKSGVSIRNYFFGLEYKEEFIINFIEIIPLSEDEPI